MSEVFSKALNYVEEQKKKGVSDAEIQGKLPQLREGGFTVNKYLPGSPPLLGMEAPTLKFEVNPDNVKLVEKFAKRRGYTVKTASDEVILMDKNGNTVAIVRNGMFAAAFPKLFEDIGKVIYGIARDLKAELELADGWEAAVARLLADRELLDKLLVAVFFLLSPILWIAIALFITPSLVFPREMLIILGVVTLALTAYLVKMYLRENFPKQK